MLKTTKEVILGSDDVLTFSRSVKLPSHETERPTIADVASHLQALRAQLLPRSNGQAAAAVIPIYSELSVEVSEVERIRTICDLLDGVFYWAQEEGTTYAAEPSLLAQVEAPEAIVACLWSGRPKIVTKALLIFNALLPHPQGRSELRRCIPLYAPSAEREGGAASWVPVVRMAAGLMSAHGGMPDLLAAAMRACAATVELDLTADALEEVLYGTMVSEALNALQRHHGAQVQLAAAELFALLAESSHLVDGTEVVSILVQVGTVLEFMLGALARYPDHAKVQSAVLRFIRAAARQPANVPRLLQAGAFGALLKLWPRLYYAPELFQCTTEAISYFVRLLDGYQRRSLVLALRRVLTTRAEIETLRLALALLHAVMHCTLVAMGPAPPLRGYAAYAMYPQPPVTTTKEDVAKEAHTAAANRCCTLRESNLQSALEKADTWNFLFEKSIPQIVMNLHDYYQTELRKIELSGDTVKTRKEGADENEEVHVIHDVCTLSKNILSMCLESRPMGVATSR